MANESDSRFCHYCGRPLGKNDNILFCSKCGVPYHVTCWNANKGCKYHDSYGKPYGNPASSSHQRQEDYASYCPDCGAMVSADAQNCIQCGSYIGGRVHKAPRTASFQAAARDDYSDRYRLEEAYIGTNQACYLEKFRGIRSNSTVVSWNWCAFLFGPYWFLYRKLYPWAAVAGLIPICLSFVLVPEVILFVSFVISVLSGLFADSIYLRQIEKRAESGSNLPETVRYMHASKYGGVNLPAVLLVLAVYAAFLFHWFL